MSGWGKYAVLALIVAVATHIVAIFATPTVLMDVAMQRLGAPSSHGDGWHLGERVTQNSRTIVRPAPDFAYSACVYDLSRGSYSIHVAPWRDYWSLSLYGANSDNFYVIDDREAHDGASIVLVRMGSAPPDHAQNVVFSATERGIAIIRRLAPTPDSYSDVRSITSADSCTGLGE